MNFLVNQYGNSKNIKVFGMSYDNIKLEIDILNL